MTCPNCSEANYVLGDPCYNCDYYEEADYWDIGWSTVRINFKEWGITYNGRIIEAELASQRDAQDLAYSWEQEMRIYDAEIKRIL